MLVFNSVSLYTDYGANVKIPRECIWYQTISLTAWLVRHQTCFIFLLKHAFIVLPSLYPPYIVYSLFLTKQMTIFLTILTHYYKHVHSLKNPFKIN